MEKEHYLLCPRCLTIQGREHRKAKTCEKVIRPPRDQWPRLQRASDKQVNKAINKALREARVECPLCLKKVNYNHFQYAKCQISEKSTINKDNAFDLLIKTISELETNPKDARTMANAIVEKRFSKNNKEKPVASNPNLKLNLNQKHGPIKTIDVKNHQNIFENNQISNSTNIAPKNLNNDQLNPQNPSSEFISSVDIEKLIQSGQEKKLEEIWKDREDLVEYREDAAQILSALYYLKGYVEKKKSYTEYMNKELVLDFPLRELEQNNFSPFTENEFYIEEGKRRIETTITIREGQSKFRKDLMDYYGPRCMITNESLVDVLEAAHIRPYNGQNTNKLENGIILRADIHKLFDKQLIGINPNDLKIHINSKLKNTTYEKYQGKKLLLKSSSKISHIEMQFRWQEFKDNNYI